MWQLVDWAEGPFLAGGFFLVIRVTYLQKVGGKAMSVMVQVGALLFTRYGKSSVHF